MTVVAYDSVTLATIPGSAQYLMGYTSGFWPTYEPMRAAFPKLAKAGHILSIAVNVGHDADCLDCEAGDATPDQVPAWVRRQLARGLRRPAVYSSVSEYPAILRLLAGAGIARSEIRVWTAHYDGRAHLCSAACNNFGFTATADATQWTDTALGRNLDQSVCQDEFFSVKTAPAPHYDWYSFKGKIDGREYDEGQIARTYDRFRDRSRPFIFAHRSELKALRAACLLLADRVAHVAIFDDPQKNGKPSWDVDHRGFRYQRLIHRSQGQRLA